MKLDNESLNLETYLESIWLDGCHDEEVGNVTKEGLHIFRVGNYTLETDSQGFKYVYQHDSELKAHEYMEQRFGVFLNYVG
jgi:hypothetical protein